MRPCGTAARRGCRNRNRPRQWPGRLVIAFTVLSGLGGLTPCTGPAVPVPVIIAPTPVVGRVAAPPDIASRRLKGALFGHADLKPRQGGDAYGDFTHPGMGHPALARFSLFEAKGSMVDDTARPTDGLALAERLAGYPPGPTADPALAPYLALPVALRQQDLMIWVQDKYFWNVPEYRTAGGRPVPYTSLYVVHFAPAAGGSEIQVIGYDAKLRTGAGWQRARGGDQMVPFSYGDTLVDVTPSLADRQVLLAVLVRLAAVDPPA